MNNLVFNDGIVNIYSVINVSQSGNMPTDSLTLKVGPLRYKKRTVGMGRFWAAQQAHVKIDMILRVPQNSKVSTQDIAIPIDGEQYRIVQVQVPEDIIPAVMDISLQRLEAKYEIN